MTGLQTKTASTIRALSISASVLICVKSAFMPSRTAVVISCAPLGFIME